MFPALYSGAQSSATASASAVATAFASVGTSLPAPYCFPQFPYYSQNIRPAIAPAYQPVCPAPVLPVQNFQSYYVPNYQSVYQPICTYPSYTQLQQSYGCNSFPSNGFMGAGFQQPNFFVPSSFGSGFGFNNFSNFNSPSSFGLNNFNNYGFNNYYGGQSPYGVPFNNNFADYASEYNNPYAQSNAPSPYSSYQPYPINNSNIDNNYQYPPGIDVANNNSALDIARQNLASTYPNGYKITNTIQTKRGLVIIGRGKLANGRTRRFKIYVNDNNSQLGSQFLDGRHRHSRYTQRSAQARKVFIR